MQITLIAAIGKNGEIGRNNELLWHLPGDLPRFKQLTMGSPLIMGRKTFDSIGRALPGRLNIILSANPDWHAEGVTVASSIEQAMELSEQDLAKHPEESAAFIIGGGQIYKLFLPYATQLELTEVDDIPVADTFFPVFSGQDFKEISRIKNQANGLHFDYVTYQRV